MLERKQGQEHENYGFEGGWRPRVQGGGQEAPDTESARAGHDGRTRLDDDIDLPWYTDDEFDVDEDGSIGFELDALEISANEEERSCEEERLAPLIAIVSGSGGVGRSTLAFLAACLAVQQGLDTVLLEGDLQFGDYGFWLDLDDGAPSLANPASCQPVKCPQGFDLYRAPVFPEVADEVCDELAANLNRIRANRDLVIVDTGGYWSGFTANLLLQCDLFLMVADSRPASVAAAVKASELCSRLGVPSTRMVVAYNRWNSRCPLSPADVADALGVEKAHCVPDGREVVEELLRSGEFQELADSGNPIVAGMSMLLRATLPRVGIPCDMEGFRKKGLFK